MFNLVQAALCPSPSLETRGYLTKFQFVSPAAYVYSCNFKTDVHQEPTSQGPHSTHNPGHLAAHPENAPSPEWHLQCPHAALEPGTPALLTQAASATLPAS